MENLRTVDSILESFHTRVTCKEVIAPSDWMNAAYFLNILLEDEHDKLFDLEQNIAQVKQEFLKESKSVAEVNIKIQSMDIYKQMRKQKAKIERVEEFIKIVKSQSKLKDNYYGNQK